jgi:hypothetical protein
MPFTISTINRTSKPGNYSVGNNLYVHIKSNTRKYWYFRFQNNGERRYLYLRSLNKLNKDQAKLAANELVSGNKKGSFIHAIKDPNLGGATFMCLRFNLSF